jgi:hypothetical protein
LGTYDFATRYELELKQMPAYQDDSPEEYRAMIAEILLEIEEEAVARRGDRQVLGVARLFAQDSCKPLGTKSKKSPAPVLFFSKRPEIRRSMSDGYKDFRDEYMVGSRRLVEAAERGYRLDPGRCLPSRPGGAASWPVLY